MNYKVRLPMFINKFQQFMKEYLMGHPIIFRVVGLGDGAG